MIDKPRPSDEQLNRQLYDAEKPRWRDQDAEQVPDEIDREYRAPLDALRPASLDSAPSADRGVSWLLRAARWLRTLRGA
jgi:hypothetical protein